MFCSANQNVLADWNSWPARCSHQFRIAKLRAPPRLRCYFWAVGMEVSARPSEPSPSDPDGVSSHHRNLLMKPHGFAFLKIEIHRPSAMPRLGNGLFL